MWKMFVFMFKKDYRRKRSLFIGGINSWYVRTSQNNYSLEKI